MIRTLINRKLDKSEKDLGVSLEYVRFILSTSLPAFFRFAKIFPISEYRKKLPLHAYHVARIVAARDEDCGTCVQIEINIALKNGVPKSVIQSVVERKPNTLPADLRTVYDFVDALVSKSSHEAERRNQVNELYGDEGLIELALAIGASRFLPVVKRTLGYGTACSMVKLDLNGRGVETRSEAAERTYTDNQAR